MVRHTDQPVDGVLDAAGWLYLVDRKKDMINAAGYKVWPREVEDVLYTHPAVREAAVIGVLMATGLRIGDCFAITAKQLDEGFESGRILVPTKGGEYREMPVFGAEAAWRTLDEAWTSNTRASTVLELVQPGGGAYYSGHPAYQRVAHKLRELAEKAVGLANGKTDDEGRYVPRQVTEDDLGGLSLDDAYTASMVEVEDGQIVEGTVVNNTVVLNRAYSAGTVGTVELATANAMAPQHLRVRSQRRAEHDASAHAAGWQSVHTRQRGKHWRIRHHAHCAINRFDVHGADGSCWATQHILQIAIAHVHRRHLIGTL